MASTPDNDLTHDAALGGRLMLWQPRRGYRFGTDAILLAAAVTAQPGDRVLDLGCGVGAAVLALMARVPGLMAAGLELQPAYADLARRNAAAANLDLVVLEGDVAAPPAALTGVDFDHVLMNPPYFDRTRGLAAVDPGRDLALGGPVAMATWLATATRRLRSDGVLTLVQRTAALPTLLAGLDARMGSVQVRPLAARAGRAPEHVLLRAVKGGRAAFRLLAPLILHAGATHGDQGFTPAIQAALQNGAALPWVD